VGLAVKREHKGCGMLGHRIRGVGGNAACRSTWLKPALRRPTFPIPISSICRITGADTSSLTKAQTASKPRASETLSSLSRVGKYFISNPYPRFAASKN
jgi:hypothetical protein